jgi:hypothetical protein
MQTVAMLLSHLFDGANASAKVSKLSQFLLDCLQPFMPLAMGNLGLCVTSTLAPICTIQFLKLSDLHAETANFFSKHCKMIHAIRISHLFQNRQKTGKKSLVRTCNSFVQPTYYMWVTYSAASLTTVVD